MLIICYDFRCFANFHRNDDDTASDNENRRKPTPIASRCDITIADSGERNDHKVETREYREVWLIFEIQNENRSRTDDS